MDKELIEAIRQVVKEEVSGIKVEVSGIKEEISGGKNDLKEFRAEFNDFKNDTTTSLDRIEKRLNATYDQTANLLVFSTETNDKLDSIIDDIKNTKNIANLALNNAAQNRLDISNLKKQG